MARAPNPLDATDLALIGALQKDANQRLEALAKLANLAPSSVHDRIRRLERDGLIRGWTIDVDEVALGLDVLAFVGIRASKPCAEIAPALEAIPAVEECHSTAGDTSMLLKVRVPNTGALLALTDRLRAVPGIVGTSTTVVLKTQIDRPIPLPAPRAAR